MLVEKKSFIDFRAVGTACELLFVTFRTYCTRKPSWKLKSYRHAVPTARIKYIKWRLHLVIFKITMIYGLISILNIPPCPRASVFNFLHYLYFSPSTQATTFSSKIFKGTHPSSKTILWNFLISKASPNFSSAIARRERIFNCPTL